MYPFHRRRDFSFAILSPASVPHLKYRPKSFILVNKGLTLSAIVVIVGSIVVSPPFSTSNSCGATVDPTRPPRLLTKNTLVVFVFIFQLRSLCLQCIYTDHKQDLNRPIALLFYAHPCTWGQRSPRRLLIKNVKFTYLQQ